MLAHILSDIHLEHYRDADAAIAYLERIRPVEIGDVLILAGDIWSLNRKATYRYLDAFRKWAIEIVYVPGNHEYYDTNPIFQGNDCLRRLQNEGLRVLGPDFHNSFTYQDVKFVGTTAWYPDNKTVRKYLPNWSDCSYTKGFIKWWEAHQLAERKLLWQEVEKDCVVVTHLLPTWSCIDPIFAKDMYNCLYVSDLEDLLIEKEPKLWIHGHSHEKLDTQIYNTRCIRNPIGYPGLNTTANATVLSIEI